MLLTACSSDEIARDVSATTQSTTTPANEPERSDNAPSSPIDTSFPYPTNDSDGFEVTEDGDAVSGVLRVDDDCLYLERGAGELILITLPAREARWEDGRIFIFDIALVEGDPYQFSGQLRDFDSLVTADNLCLLYTSPSPRDATVSRMPSSA